MLRPVLPLANYLVNQDYIAEFLCINKDKPELECNGKCYLAEQLKKASEEKEKNLPAIVLEDYPIGIVLFVSFKTTETIETPENRNFHYTNEYSFTYQNSVFHPPTFNS
jgi:hypothetical protein